MKIINGEGSSKAKIIIVGEAPGAAEEELGRPFMGRSGSLLEEALYKANIKREDVYITNLVKIRPPDNRDPLSTEIAKFLPLLRQEIQTIKPKIVVTLGRISAQALLGRGFKITRDRGVPHPTLSSYWVVPTFHPSYINRTPTSKDDFFRDIKYAVKRAYE